MAPHETDEAGIRSSRTLASSRSHICPLTYMRYSETWMTPEKQPSSPSPEGSELLDNTSTECLVGGANEPLDPLRDRGSESLPRVSDNVAVMDNQETDCSSKYCVAPRNGSATRFNFATLATRKSRRSM